MSKFAYTTYEKILTDIRSFLRGAEFNNEHFIDYLKVVDEIAIDLSPPQDEFEKKYNTILISCLTISVLDLVTYQIHNLIPILPLNA